jgi:hypothetical protein
MLLGLLQVHDAADGPAMESAGVIRHHALAFKMPNFRDYANGIIEPSYFCGGGRQ